MADEDILALADVLHERDEGFIQITQAQAGNPVTAEPEAFARDLRFLEILAERSGRPVLHNVIAVVDEFPDAHRKAMDWIHDCNERGLRIFGQAGTGRIWFENTFEETLEEAHYHLSYLPAQAAGFLDRGYLRAGAPADIVVYDLEKLRITPEGGHDVVYDYPANEWRRVQRAEGYRWILVNGEVTFEDGKPTGATPGQLLRNREVARTALGIAAG